MHRVKYTSKGQLCSGRLNRELVRRDFKGPIKKDPWSLFGKLKINEQKKLLQAISMVTYNFKPPYSDRDIEENKLIANKRTTKTKLLPRIERDDDQKLIDSVYEDRGHFTIRVNLNNKIRTGLLEKRPKRLGLIHL